jgi:hypothetical protein
MAGANKSNSAKFKKRKAQQEETQRVKRRASARKREDVRR